MKTLTKIALTGALTTCAAGAIYLTKKFELYGEPVLTYSKIVVPTLLGYFLIWHKEIFNCINKKNNKRV